MALEHNLKKLRALRKMSQQALSDALGMNRATYARYETGDNEPDIETLKKIADYYEVTTDFIITGEEPDEREAAARELPGWNNDGEVTEFIKWVKENVGDTFFFDFKNTPEGRKEMLKQFMADQKRLWEMERKEK